MGMVFQNYAVWPHKTVFENVVFGLRVRKSRRRGARRKVEDTLALVNLTGLEHRYPNELSRRPAAARGAGPQPRGRAGNPAARRAAVQSRRQAARAHARRAQAAAAPHRHHLRLCHARPGRGAGAVRPDRGDAPRPAAAIRHAARGLRAARQPHRRRLHGAGEPAARQGARRRERQRHVEAGARSRARRAAAGRASAPGDEVEVAIRPENIRLQPPATATAAGRATSASTPSSATSTNILRPWTPARRCGCRRIRRSSSPSAIRSRSTSTPAQCNVFRVSAESTASTFGVRHMNKHAAAAARRAARSTGPRRATCKLFLWEKRAADRARSAAPCCSCTARRWPRSRPSTCRCRAGRIPR